MMSSAVATLVISCAASNSQLADTEAPPSVPAPPLARFMREEVNVPFSFMMHEAAGAQRERRVHRAASVLREAARDLTRWSDPPPVSDEGRLVFFAYAENLEHLVAELEDAAAHHDDEMSADSVERIRQTCNQCHRFFRPASVISPDVAYDGYAVDHGGL
ncbi:MAG: hypothetical protein ABI867_10835 [Kofleriaceae bacterium]